MAGFFTLTGYFASTTIHRNDGQSGEAQNRQGSPQRDIGFVAGLRNFDLLQHLKQEHRAFSITIRIARNAVIGKAVIAKVHNAGGVAGRSCAADRYVSQTIVAIDVPLIAGRIRSCDDHGSLFALVYRHFLITSRCGDDGRFTIGIDDHGTSHRLPVGAIAYSNVLQDSYIDYIMRK